SSTLNYSQTPRVSRRQMVRHNGTPDPGVARIEPHNKFLRDTIIRIETIWKLL
ncbi:6037_t:CDS:1, partial [Funneliformis caledonium]